MRSRSLSTSVVILWNLSQPALWWTIPAIEVPIVKRFKAMQVKDGIRRTSLSLLLNGALKWPTSFIIYGQTPEIGNCTLTAGCSQRVVVVGGGGGGRYWSRFMENKMAVSHFTDNKFGISRFKRKKCFIRSVLLILVKNYSQRTALFDVSTILPLLVLGAVKRKPSSLFRNWGSAPSSNTETLSSEESLSYSESWSGLEIPDEDPSFLSSSCGTSLPQFTVNSTLDSRFTDNYYQKSRVTAITKLTFHEE